MAAALDGVIVGNRYELRERLAAGGMAAVYRGWDRTADRPVAVKVLREIGEMRPKDVDRFRREALIVHELHCPQIVEVYDFLEEGDSCYLVMELVEGETLKERLVRDGAMPAVEALQIAAVICRALSCAHGNGFIHRDIKPQNILLASNGEIKLTDFGIAHISEATSFTTSGIVLGTADYISPEQAQGFSLSPATDLYSLGVALFEMLTGTLPFQGSSVVAVAMLHTTKAPPPLRMLNPALPHRLERLVRRALAKRPDQRFRSADEMEGVLRREADALRSRTGPFHRRHDADSTQLLPGRVVNALGRDPVATVDIAALNTQVLPTPPAHSDWASSSPNGNFGPPPDLWQAESSRHKDESLPPDIVYAYLFTEASGTFDAPRANFIVTHRVVLTLLASACLLVALLLQRFL